MKLYLFPTFASPDPRHENAWRVRVNGACLKPSNRKLKRRVLTNVLRRLTDVPDEELESELCRQRTEPFFLAGYRKRQINFRINDQLIPARRKTKRTGQFRAKLVIPASDLSAETNEQGIFQLSAHDADSGLKAGDDLRIRMIGPTGRSIISDIDDTIKFSDVENRAELLANTFTRPFRAIEGMPKVFQQAEQAGYDFHYVTASPWQLYEPLYQFLIDEAYPEGSMHFRTFRVSDHVLKKLGVIHRSGKAAAVRRILASFPGRKFTLIGDSGEKDIDIYARCFKAFPDRVERILIRLVKPDHRFCESVIEGQMILPERVFQVFETADELHQWL